MDPVSLTLRRRCGTTALTRLDGPMGRATWAAEAESVLFTLYQAGNRVLTCLPIVDPPPRGIIRMSPCPGSIMCSLPTAPYTVLQTIGVPAQALPRRYG